MYVKAIRKILAPISRTNFDDVDHLFESADAVGLKLVSFNGCIYYKAASGWERTPLDIDDFQGGYTDD